MPWYNWQCDFGCLSAGGVSSPDVRNTIAPRFAELQSQGIHVVRWWIFPGEPWQINRDSSGRPESINPSVYTDMDAAVALAATYDLRLQLVLFSAPSVVPQSWLNNPDHRTALASALAPMFARYNGNNRIMTWEVFNEPEWEMWSGAVDAAAVVDTVTAVAASVHANTSAYVTTGAAMVDGLGAWTGSGLDYYQAHWYDYMSPGDWCAPCTTYSALQTLHGLDKPLIIGEFYAGPDTDAAGRFENFYDRGYAGAYAWSLFPERTADRMAVDLNGAGAFAASHSDVGPRSGSILTIPTPTPIPATPTPVSEAATQSFTTQASVWPDQVARGSVVTATVDVTAARSETVLVDVEFYDSTGAKVGQRYYDHVSLTAGAAEQFVVEWRVSNTAVTGLHTVKVGIFSPGWSQLHDWNNSATQFNVY